jgi:molybdopterin-guanine dinucleotide biosynthesis protein B
MSHHGDLSARPRLIAFVGFSGSGKTTLIERVIPHLTARGLRLALIKHAHHEFDVDQPGKDSWRHRRAGAAEVLISSSRRWALMHELNGAEEPGLPELVARLSPCDLVIVEGFKRATIPKIEVHRKSAGAPLLFPHDPHVIAIATDEPLATALPQLDLNDARAVADHVIGRVCSNPAGAPA